MAEGLQDGDILTLAKKDSHSRLFNLFDENKVVISSAKIERYHGLIDRR